MRQGLLLPDTPGGELRPGLESIFGPLNRLIGVARIAGIRNLQRFRSRWWNKFEGVTSDVHVRDLLLDFRHVTTYTLIPGGVGGMMRMLFDARDVMWSVG